MEAISPAIGGGYYQALIQITDERKLFHGSLIA